MEYSKPNTNKISALIASNITLLTDVGIMQDNVLSLHPLDCIVLLQAKVCTKSGGFIMLGKIYVQPDASVIYMKELEKILV